MNEIDRKRKKEKERDERVWRMKNYVNEREKERERRRERENHILLKLYNREFNDAKLNATLLITHQAPSLNVLTCEIKIMREIQNYA